jgi:transmembrane sensor
MSDSGSKNVQAHAELMAAAVSWHEKMSADEVDNQTQRSFDHWHGSSTACAQAYAQVQKVRRVADNAANRPEFLALRHQTLARTVVPRRSTRPQLAAATALFALCAATVVYFATGRPDKPVRVASIPIGQYQSGVGERLTVNLADGSTVVLNTASRMLVDYSEQTRHLVLESGEAFFTVAKDASRPFVVTADDRSITAHGTQFDVRLAQDGLQVGLLEGVVSVRPHEQPAAAEIKLLPNQILVVNHETSSVRSVDVDRLASWREGLVFFDNDSLADAAAEMNRYVAHPQIEVRASAAQIKLSGAFRTGEVAAFVQALEQGFPVAIVEQSAERIVVQGRRAPLLTRPSKTAT